MLGRVPLLGGCYCFGTGYHTMLGVHTPCSIAAVAGAIACISDLALALLLSYHTCTHAICWHAHSCMCLHTGSVRPTPLDVLPHTPCCPSSGNTTCSDDRAALMPDSPCSVTESASCHHACGTGGQGRRWTQPARGSMLPPMLLPLLCQFTAGRCALSKDRKSRIWCKMVCAV